MLRQHTQKKKPSSVGSEILAEIGFHVHRKKENLRRSVLGIKLDTGH